MNPNEKGKVNIKEKCRSRSSVEYNQVNKSRKDNKTCKLTLQLKVWLNESLVWLNQSVW